MGDFLGKFIKTGAAVAGNAIGGPVGGMIGDTVGGVAANAVSGNDLTQGISPNLGALFGLGKGGTASAAPTLAAPEIAAPSMPSIADTTKMLTKPDNSLYSLLTQRAYGQ